MKELKDTLSALDLSEWKLHARGASRDTIGQQLVIEDLDSLLDVELEDFLSDHGLPPGRYKVGLRSAAPSGARTEARKKASRAGPLSTFVDVGGGGVATAELGVDDDPSLEADRNARAARARVRELRARKDELSIERELARLEEDLTGRGSRNGPDPTTVLLLKLLRDERSSAAAPAAPGVNVLDLVLKLIQPLGQLVTGFLERQDEKRREDQARFLELIQEIRAQQAPATGNQVKELVSLAKDLGSIMGVLRETMLDNVGGEKRSTEDRLLELGTSIFQRAQSMPAPAPAPVGPQPEARPEPAPQPRHLGPVIAGGGNGQPAAPSADDVGKARVREFVAVVMREALNGSDPGACAEDAFEQGWLLLPGKLRAAVLSGKVETLHATLSPWLPKEQVEQLAEGLRNPELKAWLEQFIEGLLDCEAPDEEQAEEGADNDRFRR